MRNHRSQLLPALVLAALSASRALTAQNPAAAVEPLITECSLAAHIGFLASDELEGRGVGSRGDVLARRYVRSQLQRSGLEPGAGKDAWDQAVPITGITALPSEHLSIKSRNGAGTFSAPVDYVAMAGRPEKESAWRNLDLVFAGYGITAPEHRWNDFKDADIAGKVLLVMNNDPASDPELFAGKTRLYYGRWSYKYEEAARRGAAGVIIIHTEESAGYPFQVIQAKQGVEEFHLPFEADEKTLAIRAWCSEEAAAKLAASGGFELDALRAAAEKRDFVPVPLGVKVTCVTQNTVRSIESGNTIGRLEGGDPALRSQAVVVTAHFDHLGIGPARQGDTIYNGALDNASGCAALLEIAQACAALKTRPRRTILFAAVTAEESGLLGSQYYARHPVVPAKATVANFNIDGLNMWGRTKDVGMIGYGKNSLTALAQSVAKSRGRELVPDSEPDKGLFYRSDHFNFARIGIPCAYFKTGNDFLENSEKLRAVKLAYTKLYYHTPQDQFDARWNLQGAVEDVRLLLECLLRVADDDAVPAWTRGDEFEKAR